MNVNWADQNQSYRRQEKQKQINNIITLSYSHASQMACVSHRQRHNPNRESKPSCDPPFTIPPIIRSQGQTSLPAKLSDYQNPSYYTFPSSFPIWKQIICSQNVTFVKAFSLFPLAIPQQTLYKIYQSESSCGFTITVSNFTMLYVQRQETVVSYKKKSFIVSHPLQNTSLKLIPGYQSIVYLAIDSNILILEASPCFRPQYIQSASLPQPGSKMNPEIKIQSLISKPSIPQTHSTAVKRHIVALYS